MAMGASEVVAAAVVATGEGMEAPKEEAVAVETVAVVEVVGMEVERAVEDVASSGGSQEKHAGC